MSTAAELIQAANACNRMYAAMFTENKNSETPQLKVMRLCAEHVLATVREDDDEPANWVWVGSNCGLPMTFEVDDGVTKYSLETKPIATQFTVGCDVTRGQMRHLFKALGIELKETT